MKVYNHSGKFSIQGYSRLSCKGPLKLLNKRPRPKHEYCNNSAISCLILMNFCMQDPIGASFALANFEQGCKGQRPKGCKANFFFKKIEAFYKVFPSFSALKITIAEDSVTEPRVPSGYFLGG